jgi:coatomer subunit beta
VAASVIHSLIDFLSDTSLSSSAASSSSSSSSSSANSTALDVVSFVREVVEKFPDLRPSITENLAGVLPSIKSGKVFRGVLWILGEYVDSKEGIEGVFEGVRGVIGEVPILSSEQRLLDRADEEAAAAGEPNPNTTENKPSTRPRVLADGTYATETAYDTNVNSSASQARLEAVKAAAKPPLRTLILGGDFFTGAVLSVALVKLVLRYERLVESGSEQANSLRAEVSLFSFECRPLS